MFDVAKDRLSYGELLRPDVGYRLDFAVGMTYSLDLEALLGVPISLGLLEEGDEEQMRSPLYVLEAIRESAGKIALFCNAGSIQLPERVQSVYSLLEESVFQVKRPDKSSFHPKLWVLKYSSPGGDTYLKLLVLSRNLTFDTSLDLCVALRGRPGRARRKKNKPLADLLAYAAQFASTVKRKAVLELAEEVGRVADFEVEHPFEDYAFFPMGIPGYPGTDTGLLERKRDLFVASPFLSDDILSFDAMQSLLDQIAAQGKGLSRFRNVPMEYVKSSPYLLSFMENYQLKKQIRAHFTHGFDFAATAGRSASHLLLKRSAIQNYRPIPFEHAKLEQLANVAFHQDREGAENLLWVPPSNPYYNTKGVFSKHGNYSKVLVFSSWEMVPRMIAVMLSYEAERRTIGKLYHDPSLKWGRGYFATKEERRYGVARLREESEAIVTLPSPILAKCYCPEEYLGRDIAYVRREVGKQIRVRLETLRKERKIPVRGRASAQSLGACIQALDGAQEGTPLSAIPTDAVEILTDIAIASPAVCAYRLLRRTWQSAGTFQVQKIAGEIAGLFVSLFNKPESAAILDLLYGRKSDDAYYQTVFRYCVEGNLQAVLDEYAHVLAVPGAELEQAMMDGFIDTATLQIDTRESFPDQEKNRARMRTHFAVGYFSAKRDEEHATHTDNIRRTFNSPFRPFVLATTSIGQEGLDFHAYCRKVVHWNLPSNPIDLEQREGRVNRYKCLAVRQNIAQQYGREFDWERMFERAGREKKGNFSDLVPFWCLPTKEGQPRIPIERIVPLYPLSRDKLRYQRLIKVLSLYRLTLGQPRQEELLAVLDQELTEQDSKKLFMDLSPYDREWAQEEQ